jgi:ribosomal protein L40E
MQGSPIYVNGAMSIVAVYTRQYYLDVISEFGRPQGSGWYDEGSLAVFSIDPSPVPVEGFLGMLGIKHNFVKWTGDSSDSKPESSVIVEGPRTVTAVWETGYVIILILVFAAVGVAGAISAFVYRRKRSVVSNVQHVDIKFCERCGAQLSPEMKFCNKCGAMQ